jgi:hypothetical protein
MWAMASSSPATTLMLMMGARYSSDQSCSGRRLQYQLARRASGPISPEWPGLGVAAHFHALGGIDGADRGKNFAATPRATSRLSLALQGLYFCVLALSATLTAMAMSQGSSTYTVAVAVQVLDHRHLGLAADALDQALAAARDDHVHVLGHGDQLADGGAVGGLHQLHAVGRQAGLRSAPAAPAAPAPCWNQSPPSRRAGCRRCRS